MLRAQRSTAPEAPAGTPAVAWTGPSPRPGWRGAVDRAVGPGATPHDQTLVLAVALAGAAAAALLASPGWPAWKLALAVLLAFDLIGGIAANAGTPAQRWFHRSGRGVRHHVGFAALHIVQIAVVVRCFRDGDLLYGAVAYLVLLAAVATVAGFPQRLRRPVALALALAGIVALDAGLGATPGLEWFAPALYLKLVVAHTTREAPFA